MSTDRPSDEDLDIAEDKRLRALGIETSVDPVDIMIRLRKKQEEIDARKRKEKEEKRQKPAG